MDIGCFNTLLNGPWMRFPFSLGSAGVDSTKMRRVAFSCPLGPGDTAWSASPTFTSSWTPHRSLKGRASIRAVPVCAFVLRPQAGDRRGGCLDLPRRPCGEVPGPEFSPPADRSSTGALPLRGLWPPGPSPEAREVGIVVCTIGPDLEASRGEGLSPRPGEGPGPRRGRCGHASAGLRGCGPADSGMWLRREVWGGSGMRAQPGQEGWPIQQQEVVFRLIPGERIGVRLTENDLMLPRKSISLVIGMGPGHAPGQGVL